MFNFMHRELCGLKRLSDGDEYAYCPSALGSGGGLFDDLDWGEGRKPC